MSGSSSPQNVPSNIDFATEVKSDRLNLLAQVTIGVSAAFIVFAFTFMVSVGEGVVFWVVAPLVLVMFCVVTMSLLKRERYESAAIIYTAGLLVTVSVAMTDGQGVAIQVVPFVFVLVTFVAGLLLRPTHTFVVAFVASVLTVLIPAIVMPEGFEAIEIYHIVAVLLIFLSATLAAQVTGELYAVTEWALLNYQRERSTNNELFENRNELRRSLKRSEVLGEQLQESNKELETARNAAEAAKNFRGQFLANMSHELRTPLNAIIGFSETMLKFPMMYDDSDLPDAYRSDLNQINTSGQQLLSLINDILDLARVDAGKLEIYMQRVVLKSVIDAVIATANGLIGTKKIELKLDLPDPIPDVWADENRVRQVLLNLYSNAAKFTEAGSITLTIKEIKDGVQFSVTDTGCGIPEAQLSAIFEEFRQADSSTGRDPRAGSGLGLAISRQLLDLMKGRIWAESEVGKGSTFHFVLQPFHKNKNETVELTRSQIKAARDKAEKQVESSTNNATEIDVDTPVLNLMPSATASTLGQPPVEKGQETPTESVTPEQQPEAESVSTESALPTAEVSEKSEPKIESATTPLGVNGDKKTTETKTEATS